MLTLNDAADAIRTGATSPTQLAAGCLERIEQTDGTLRAWAHVDRDGALRCAELLERELRDGVRRGPLHGVPIGVKDIIDVAAMPTRAGSPLRHGHMAATDAPVVAQLRAAGAIVLGKTVTTQFACFDPAETVNPWNPARTPGGSSSGSAVAVATGSCFAALGTQTGGSIIRPATYCGVVGMKPTRAVGAPWEWCRSAFIWTTWGPSRGASRTCGPSGKRWRVIRRAMLFCRTMLRTAVRLADRMVKRSWHSRPGFSGQRPTDR